MTYDHAASRLHREELDREIEQIRTERLMDRETPADSLVDRARRRTGSALMAAGRAVAGPEARPLKAFDV
jgi:hypothetical protein